MNETDVYKAVNAGLECYRGGQVFEAHEIWEEAWRASDPPRREVLQGLIQLAAARHKYEQQQNPAGAKKLLDKALNNLEQAGTVDSSVLSFDLVDLHGRIANAQATLAQGKRFWAVPLPEHAIGHGIVYLHGFASSPSSKKASAIAGRLRDEGWVVRVPDLNENDFEGLTLSRILKRARRELFDRTLIVGSSLGGYAAALLAQKDPRVRALVLMAPAFQFAGRLEQRYGSEALNQWKERGRTNVEHYAYGGLHSVSYALYEDARTYPAIPPLPVETYILHGKHDDVVPETIVRRAAALAEGPIELDVVDDDHSLLSSVGRAVDRAVSLARTHLPLPKTHV